MTGVQTCALPICAALRVALDAPRTWQLGNASVNRLLASDDGLVLVGWGDTFHLDDAALDETSFAA